MSGSDAPHWYVFKRLNAEPTNWTFEALDEQEGRLTATNDATDISHEFHIKSWLVERERTHDRYFGIEYVTVDENGDDQPWAFHISKDESIARNGFLWARSSLDREGNNPHVLVRTLPDDTVETREFPTEWMAEKAAELQVDLKLRDPEREYRVNVFSREKWQEHQELYERVETRRTDS